MSDRDDGGRFSSVETSPEQIARIRERMNTLVDCRALAQEMLEALPELDQALLEYLRDSHGIDGTRTLTELEKRDLGDTYDVADEPAVHALRYVPVVRWSPANVYLMLTYGHGEGVGMALAEWFLSKDPLIEAQYHSGDLLVAYSSLACGAGRFDRVKALSLRYEEQIWRDFEALARSAGITGQDAEAQRVRLLHGRRSEPGQNPFLDVEVKLPTLARLREDFEPVVTLATARVEQLYAPYRPRKSIELVPLTDLENPDYRKTIEDSETFSFHRDTVFSIVRDSEGEGVRLRIFSESAIDHRQGIWFSSISTAKAEAKRDFGIGDEDWIEPKSAE